MANVRFILDNAIDSTNLSVSNPSTDPKYEVANLTKISRSKVFRSSNLIDQSNTEIYGVICGEASPILIDDFVEGVSEANLSDHIPDLTPLTSIPYYSGDDGFWSCKTDTYWPHYLAAGESIVHAGTGGLPGSTYRGVATNHEITGSKTIKGSVGYSADTSQSVDRQILVIIRGAGDGDGAFMLDGSVILVITRNMISTDNEGGTLLRLATYTNAGGIDYISDTINVLGQTLNSSPGDPVLRNFTIIDDGENISAYFDDYPTFIASGTTTVASGSSYSGIGYADNFASVYKFVFGHFEVYNGISGVDTECDSSTLGFSGAGEPFDCNALVFIRHNFSSTITFRLELFSESNYTGFKYDSGPIQVTDEQAASDLWEWGEFNWGNISWGADKKDTDLQQYYNLPFWLPQTYTGVKSFKITLATIATGALPLYCNNPTIYCNDTSIDCNDTIYGTGDIISPGIDYFEIGRIYLGKYIEPAYNISYGHNISWRENTDQYRPNSGTLHSDITTRNKQFAFSLNTIPVSDRFDLQKQLMDKGLSGDFYVSIFPEHDTKAIDYSGMVKFVKIPKLTQFQHTYYKSNYVMEII